MMYDIYAGIEDKLVEGSIDTHLHIFPDYVPRDIDIIELAIEASKAKMDAIVCKDHFFTNVGQAWAAQWVVEQMVKKGELEKACKVFGTHILAWTYHRLIPRGLLFRLYESVNSRPNPADPDDASRAWLKNYYKDDIAQLEQLLDCDLSAWK